MCCLAAGLVVSGPAIDVRSSHGLAQVKWKSGATRLPDVQNLVGAHGTGSDELVFFSASGCSTQALDYADEVGVALFTYDPAGAAEAANPEAKRMLERARPRRGRDRGLGVRAGARRSYCVAVGRSIVPKSLTESYV